MEINAMHALLKSHISASRYQHTLGVIECAKELALVFGADAAKAEIAALLHDCAKCIEKEKMIALSLEEGFAPDDFERASEPILHAPAGAALARRLYGIQDEEILNAIRSHTIGCIHPTKLDAIIFVADFIEKTRKPFDGLDDARKLSKTDLLGAMKLCASLSGAYVESRGGKMHPITVKMINDTEDLI
ncbi:MAG: HD domain-containing protein [Clostridiales bacterium]|nr:HD domain-containing protein [Clostridiales bacterium]